MELGLAISAAAVVLGIGRSLKQRLDLTLPGLLAAVWAVPLGLLAADARMATFVFTAAALNLFVASIALVLVTRDPARIDARLVGGLSMAIMPAHWIMSVSNGTADWTIYAWSCNAVFVLQCLVAGGWFDGVGRSFVRLVSRLWPVHHVRDGGR